MTHNSRGLWPRDPDAINDNRTVDDLEIPDLEISDLDISDLEMSGDDPGYTLDPDDPDDEADLDEPITTDWGDDADTRLVDLGEDDPDVEDDLDR